MGGFLYLKGSGALGWLSCSVAGFSNSSPALRELDGGNVDWLIPALYCR